GARGLGRICGNPRRSARRRPIGRSRSLMCGTAAAASSRSTVMRTISEPARASAATWAAVAAASAVSVLVIDWTTIGAPPPTATWPTLTATEVWRGGGAAGGGGGGRGLRGGGGGGAALCVRVRVGGGACGG